MYINTKPADTSCITIPTVSGQTTTLEKKKEKKNTYLKINIE